MGSLSARRAWIEMYLIQFLNFAMWSLSARRAWIEILNPMIIRRLTTVALRKESVDRNCFCKGPGVCINASLSARRAWIEMRQYMTG